MSEPLNADEASALRALLAKEAPTAFPVSVIPLPDPDSWSGQQGLHQEHQRQERLAAAKAAHEKAQAEQALKDARLAVVKVQIAGEEALLEPIEQSYREQAAPVDAEYWRQIMPVRAKYDEKAAPIKRRLARLHAEAKELE